MTQEQINGLIGTINSQKQTVDACLNKLRKYETALEAAKKALRDVAEAYVMAPDSVFEALTLIRAAYRNDTCTTRT